MPESDPDATAEATLSSLQHPEHRDTRRSARLWSQALLSLTASFLITGLGHVLAGKPRRGLAWFVALAILTGVLFAVMATPRLVPALVIMFPLQILLVIWMFADAFATGFRSRRCVLPNAPLRNLAAGVFLTLTCYASPASLVARWYTARFVQPYKNVGGSMSPTLEVGDRVFADRSEPIRRWSIVAYYPPGKPVVHLSRVVGLPGDTVEIIDDVLHVNGDAIQPPPGLGPYASVRYVGRPCTGCDGNPIQLDSDEYFLLSDNTRRAIDGRYWEEPVPGHQLGAMPRSRIVGRVTAIYWPISRWATFPSRH